MNTAEMFDNIMDRLESRTGSADNAMRERDEARAQRLDMMSEVARLTEALRASESAFRYLQAKHPPSTVPVNGPPPKPLNDEEIPF